jgi:glycerol-3-phosphate dehydrogenase (NAD(P)+)
VIDGFGMGHNARAALLTRGLAEIRRLVVALGGQAGTVNGLSGLGDLLLTATGDLSRNRQVGLRLGRGESLESVLADLGQVAEGVLTARSGLELARLHQVEVPLIEETQRILQGEHTVAEAVRHLLTRAPRAEM